MRRGPRMEGWDAGGLHIHETLETRSGGATQLHEARKLGSKKSAPDNRHRLRRWGRGGGPAGRDERPNTKHETEPNSVLREETTSSARDPGILLAFHPTIDKDDIDSTTHRLTHREPSSCLRKSSTSMFKPAILSASSFKSHPPVRVHEATKTGRRPVG